MKVTAEWKRHAMERAAKWKQAAAEAFDRADEKGGDLRDELMAAWSQRSADFSTLRARVQASPVAKQAMALRRRLVGGAKAKAVASDVETAYETATVATAPTVDALPPLGDEQKAAQIYGKVSCPWTQRARDLLDNRGVPAVYVDLTDDKNALTKVRLESETKQHTVPYVFLRGEFVGGYNALAEIERLGQLELRTMTAADREAAPAHYKRVQVVERVNSNETAPGEVAEPTVLE